MKLHRLTNHTRCPACKEPRLAFLHEETTGDLYRCMACYARVHHEICVKRVNGRPVSGCRLVSGDDASIHFDSDCIAGQVTSDPPRCA